MSVTMVSGFWLSRRNPVSGIFVQQQAKAFGARGVPLNVVVPVRWPRRRLDVALDAGPAVVRPLPVLLPLALSRLSPRLRLCALEAGARALAGAYTCSARTDERAANVVHCQDIIYAALALPFLRSAISRAGVITIHGETPLLDCYRRGSDTPPLIRRMWVAADAVAVVGSSLVPYVEQLGYPPEKVRVVPNGTVWPSMAEPATARGSPEFVVCSIANLTVNKPIDDNLRALARVRQCMPTVRLSYWIIGDGPAITWSLLANVLLKLALIPRFGATGAAWATACSIVLWNLALSHEVRRHLGINAGVLGAAGR